jgi:hypothetical protein
MDAAAQAGTLETFARDRAANTEATMTDAERELLLAMAKGLQVLLDMPNDFSKSTRAVAAAQIVRRMTDVQLEPTQ